MVPINKTDAFLREKYGLTEQYSKDYPEDFEKVLSVVRRIEEDLQEETALRQNLEEHSRGMTRLIEKSEILDLKLGRVIESSKKNKEALQNLANSSSEMREITSNIANVVSNCANRIFNPVRNGFYFLTGHRGSAAVLPRENQLAIEYTPENTISNTGSTNQTSGDVKKNFASLLIFFAVSGGLYFLHAGEQRSLWYSSIDPQSICYLKAISGFVQNNSLRLDRNLYFTVSCFWIVGVSTAGAALAGGCLVALLFTKKCIKH